MEGLELIKTAYVVNQTVQLEKAMLEQEVAKMLSETFVNTSLAFMYACIGIGFLLVSLVFFLYYSGLLEEIIKIMIKKE